MTGVPARVTIPTQRACTYCEHAKVVVARVGHDFDISIDEVSLESDEGR